MDSKVYDVAVVGGGPSGSAAGVFTARYGLETIVFDRGCSSLRRCALLENYLGFPAGIDVDTFYELMHDHLRESGCEVIDETVDGIGRDSSLFHLETGCGRTVRAKRVIAATKFGAPYLESLGQDAPSTTDADEAGFDSTRVDGNGRTEIDGLYAAGPLAGTGDQAIIAAGHGATVAHSLLTDVRRDAGYWPEIEDPYDWVRRDAELSDEWERRERWHEWFDAHDESEELSAEAVEHIREEYIDEALGMYTEEAEIERKIRRGHRRLAEHFDDETMLEAVPDEHVLEYAEQISPGSDR